MPCRSGGTSSRNSASLNSLIASLARSHECPVRAAFSIWRLILDARLTVQTVVDAGEDRSRGTYPHGHWPEFQSEAFHLSESHFSHD